MIKKTKYQLIPVIAVTVFAASYLFSTVSIAARQISRGSDGMAASASELLKREGVIVNYTVSFVDEGDHGRKIFNTQSGSVQEGSVINISFPEQIVGSDGYIWKATEPSPQVAEVYQSGTHKYYIEYRQGDKTDEPEDPDAAAKERLEQWIQTAWKADCAITGRNPEEQADSNMCVSDTEQNNRRIKNLVSMINNAKWHYFYMIGKNFIPQTTILGTGFDSEYSAVTTDTFSIGKDRYTVVRVGVLRKWEVGSCEHGWEIVSANKNSCLSNGEDTYRCVKCSTEETVLLPALGHMDRDKDSLCDRCKKRAFPQGKGVQIQTILKMGSEEMPLTFTCIEENYRGTGKMLYLADTVLDEGITGTCFTDGNSYEDSGIRQYFRYGFSNDISVASALQVIIREEAGGIPDYAALLSREEYEAYAAQGVIEAPGQGYFLRTEEGGSNVYAVQADGTLTEVPASGNKEFGARPFILLDKPDTEDTAEPYRWQEGDVQARQIGRKTYLFRCVDEDYSDNQSTHRKAALFLCDTVIRSDIDSDSEEFKTFSFGTDNNYKKSLIREWLSVKTLESQFNLEPIYIGVNRAYMGSTAIQSFEQMDKERLNGYDIGFQFMHDRLFCLSVEEAVKYKDHLWRFNGSEENNPNSQISPYSAGYYLRTPFYLADETGKFRYSEDVYIVDLEQGNIHTTKTGVTGIGIRPAFALPMPKQ